MARGGKGGGGRRYVRDNRGRFASKGAGATARGGRLKTASGKKRATQTMKASGGVSGTVGKPKGLKPGTIKAKPQVSSARKPAARTSKAPVNKAKTAYKAARADARMRKYDLRGADVNERRMANTAAAKVKNMERRRSASVPKASADSPRSRQTAKATARMQRAYTNKKQAYGRYEKNEATNKDSRKASVAKQAMRIYRGEVDPKVKSRARLTRTQNPDVLRDRIKRGEKLTAAKAKKAAAKPAATAKPARRRAGIASTAPKGSFQAVKIEQAKGRVKQFTQAKKSVDSEMRQVRQQIKDARKNATTFGAVPGLKLKLLTLQGKSKEYKATIERANREIKGNK